MLKPAVVSLSLAAILAAAPAMAQRPSTLGMSCASAQRLVAQSGAIVLSTGRYTYDRFVSYPAYCAAGEYAYDGTAPTSDRQECVIGYVCKAAPPLWEDDDDGFFR